MVVSMTKHKLFIKWLKTCPVDYLQHGTVNTKVNSKDIIVTFDLTDSLSEKLNNLNQVTSKEHNELILERKKNG